MVNIEKIFTSDKSKLIIAVLFMAGVFLIFLPDGKKSDTAYVTGSSVDEMQIYSKLLSDDLKQSVSHMLNDEEIEVMVTLESSFEAVYASDAVVTQATAQEKTDTRSEKQMVLIGPSSQPEPVVVKKIPPKIKGVVVVCKKEISKETVDKITKLAATALNVSETKIYVTGGNLYENRQN